MNTSTSKLLSLCFVSASLIVLSGCSTLTSPKEQPVIEDKVGETYRTLAVTAERRIIIFGRVQPQADGQKGPVVCAEPSPDVAESLVTSLKAIAEVSAKKGSDEAKVGGEFSRNLATAVSNVFSRSQGVQFFRDSSYALCQAYINGLIESEDYKKALEKITQLAFVLIDKEIPSMEAKRAENASKAAQEASATAAQSAQAAKTAATDAKANAEKVEATLNAAKKAASESK
jgi:hypothetical protein